MNNHPTIEQGAFEIIKKLLKKLSEEELRLLNQKIVERLNLMHSARQLNQVAKFSANEKVSFDHNGKLIRGTIIRLNRKTVSIIDEFGSHWTVAPIFLKKIIGS
jgi:hypothetical protein